jgi:predicted nucleotidyltransferase
MKKAKYKSKNRYKEFLTAAKLISKKISKIDGVVGILATGGLGRGHCDDFSDLDLIVYADDKKVKKIEKYIAVGFLRYKEIEFDTPVLSYQKALNQHVPSKYWSQMVRWDQSNSQILFDKDKRIARLLKEKLVFTEAEQKKLLSFHRQEVDELLNYHFRLWEKRGDLINLAHCLIQTTEHIILWIYAKNKKFQPYTTKWLFYYLENNLIPEAKCFHIIKKAYLSPTKTLKQAKRIRDNLVKLCKEIGIQFHYEDLEAVFQQNRENWKKARDKTKYYLSW